MKITNKIKYVDRIRKKAGKAIEKYTLISEGDRVLVAISGGKDSLALLDILSNRRKIIPFNFQLDVAHVYIKDNPEFTDIQYLKNYCDKTGVTLHLKALDTTPEPRNGKSRCFVCSWHRRKEIFKTANELQSTRVALGHHLDDILETMLMNMTIHGEFSTMPPDLFIEKGSFSIIRPLTLITEQEIRNYCSCLGITPVEGICPYEDTNKREEFKKIVSQLSKLNKMAKVNLFKSMSNINTKHLPES